MAHSDVTLIKPSRGLFHLDLAAIWEYRELLVFLIWRDVKVRYKQTVIGAAWAIIQPLMTMLIFTIIFSRFAKVPSDGLPYPIFAYTALLPWSYFSQALGRGSGSLVGSAHLITKVYFPRLILPLSAAAAPIVDFALASLVLGGMMAWYGITPGWGVLAIPFLLLIAFLTALAVSLWLSSLNVRYRDVSHTIPFLMQLWMYASPIAYPASLVPERWRTLYALNPMVGVVEGFRWALLGKAAPDVGIMAVSGLAVLALLFGGLLYFRRTERTFADLV